MPCVGGHGVGLHERHRLPELVGLRAIGEAGRVVHERLLEPRVGGAGPGGDVPPELEVREARRTPG